MRRIYLPGLCPFFLGAILLAGCSGSSPGPQKEEPKKEEPADKGKPSLSDDEKKLLKAVLAEELAKRQNEASPAAGEPAPQDRFNSALLQALLLRADGKHDEALTLLEQAQALANADDNKQLVQREIDREKALVAQQAAVMHTQADIQSVLTQGKADEASRLATTALQQYGAGDDADRLSRLKRQADALVAAAASDKPGQRDRFRADGDAAFKDGNLRAAAIAYESALQFGDDAALRKQLDEIQATLTRYDDQRRRAAELRRNSGSLEDALAAYQEAARAWDTLPVRQEIDECTLALQKRRQRLSVADFEVLGDVGLPFAGRRTAEELLPAFKSRFDLVERQQVSRLLEELKLQTSELADNDQGRQKLGQLARVRYLVLGSVSVGGGVTASARLVDVQTGLIVQTGKVTAPTAEQLLPLLADLANQLMMSDDQKLAYEQDLAKRQASAVTPVSDTTPVPPPPPPPQPDAPPPLPLVTTLDSPLVLEGVAAGDVSFPPPLSGGPAPSVVIVAENEEPLHRRSLRLAVELGDNLYRRGRYREAFAQFDLALSLSSSGPTNDEVRVRLERCRPCVPPDVVVAPRPRVAVLNFVTEGTRPGLGAWTAEGLAPYFSTPYEVVDRGEVFWYMRRLGLSFRDVYRDPVARRWLGRAMNVRYLVLGCVTAKDGLEASAHLVDTEGGFEIGSGRVRADDAHELRCVLPELVHLTLMSPGERDRYEEQQAECRRLLVQARQCQGRREFSVAITFCEKARKLCPRNVEVSVIFERNQEEGRRVEWEASRRAAYEQEQQRCILEAQRRQELAHRAEVARIQAEQQSAALAEAGRRQQEIERERAYQQLCIQADVALRNKNFQFSVQLYESAVALRPNDEGFRQLAGARAHCEEERRSHAVTPGLVAIGGRQVRQDELTQARDEVERARANAEAEARAANQAQTARDQAEYTRLIDTAKLLSAQGKYPQAVASLQAARRLRATDEVESLLNVTYVAQARATDQQQHTQQVAALERRLAEEKQRREQAEAEAKRKEQLYQDALRQAQQARAANQFEVAVARFQAAADLYHTDVALNGLAEAQQARANILAAQREHAAAEAQKARVGLLVQTGQQALQAGQYDEAVRTLTDARKLEPTNVDVLTALGKAEHARDENRAQAQRAKQDADQRQAFQKMLDGGRANLAAKQYDAAVVALREAVKLNPTDPTATAALQEAERGRATVRQDAKQEADAKVKADAYQKWMDQGRLALSTQQYETAINAFREAQKVMPGDQSAATFLQDAQKARDTALATRNAEARKREEDTKRAADVQKALAQGRAALQARNLEGAAKSFQTAAQLAPGDGEVQRAQNDLQQAQAAARVEADAHARRQQAFQDHLKAGRDALTGKRYDDAIKDFGEATQLAPEDRTAQDLLHQAQKARDDARATSTAAAAADAEKQKRLSDYQQAMKSGRDALAAKRYDDAVKAFTDAGRFQPGDRDAATSLAQADKARTDALAAADTKRQDEARRAEKVRQLVTAGHASLAAGQVDAASKAFTEASQLAPQDPSVVQALKDLDQARAAAKASAAADAEKQKRLAEYQQLMKAGRDAVTAKHYDDAVKAFTDAGRLEPGDRDAASSLAQADKARADARALQDAELRKKQEDDKRRSDFNAHLAQAQAAMTAKHYDNAVKAYNDALLLIPGDPTAAKGLAEATKALEAAKAPPPKPPVTPPTPPPPVTPPAPPKAPVTPPTPLPSVTPPAPPKPSVTPPTPPPPVTPPAPPKASAEYTKHMQAGAALDKQQKYADATQAYQDALKAQPGDGPATDALHKAELDLHLSEGNKALAAKRFPDAVKEFEAALKAAPGNAEATALLKKAKEGKP